MSFYSGPSSLGTCNACGSSVLDGGQSGAYCSNNDCKNGWGGGRKADELSHEEADNLAQRVLGDMDPMPGESPDEYRDRLRRADDAFAARHPNWRRGDHCLTGKENR